MEIGEIAKAYFRGAKPKPCPAALKFDNGSRYDDLIAGWTQYWNEVLKPEPLLDPNLVKALIASESSFYPEKLANKEDPKSARGLMQVTNLSRSILGNERGELKDHYVVATIPELNDPNVNICAGVRWLFQKRALASSHAGKSVSWEEAAAEYKGLTKDLGRGQKRAKDLYNRFLDYLKDFKECKK